MAKGKLPRLRSGFEDYLDAFPDEALITLDGFVEHLAAGTAYDPLAAGYLFLMQGQLKRLRYRTDRGFVDAIHLVEKFQHAAANYAATGYMDGMAASMIGSALRQAGIPASEELISRSRSGGCRRRFPAAPRPILWRRWKK